MKRLNLRISGKKIMLDFNEHFHYLIKVNESLNLGAAEHFKNAGLTYVDVPELVGITGACENIDTLFKIDNRLDLPLFITQTGQLALEQALQTSHGVYTVIHSGRDEETEDKRHLRQFRLTEEEFDCTLAGMDRKNYDEEKMFTSLLDHIEKTIKAMIERVLADNKKALETKYKRDVEKLGKILKHKFYRISYEQVIKSLNTNGFKKLKFGDDLNAEHEAKIVDMMNKEKREIPVFITKYPKEIKFFNMKVSRSDPRVVLSADLILPFAGEAVGSAVREHDFMKLNNRLITSGMYRLFVERGGTYDDFLWYLDVIKKNKTYPHAGYGVGNERVLQFIFQEDDIRNVSLFSLFSRQTGDWDQKGYGRAAIISSDKKRILLSIGRAENKKYLLPLIKKLGRTNRYILYATENTHKFLTKNNVPNSLVYKISQVGKAPNIGDLIGRRFFDIIINIPTGRKVRIGPEFTDGTLIRRSALQTGANLITDPRVGVMIIQNLIK